MNHASPIGRRHHSPIGTAAAEPCGASHGDDTPPSSSGRSGGVTVCGGASGRIAVDAAPSHRARGPLRRPTSFTSPTSDPRHPRETPMTTMPAAPAPHRPPRRRLPSVNTARSTECGEQAIPTRWRARAAWWMAMAARRMPSSPASSMAWEAHLVLRACAMRGDACLPTPTVASDRWSGRLRSPANGQHAAAARSSVRSTAYRLVSAVLVAVLAAMTPSDVWARERATSAVAAAASGGGEAATPVPSTVATVPPAT